ncbi:hypothetical protein BD324DRAFT_587922 [Kockovaella imperatae]|uniref:Actin cytoskeleton-regulatory complex protein SLA1 n=1 Tax=Kockovaella imperatae TaxID=4999 RepID=A0A1Y1UM60_9TREE|nr:hypothetical protein BD324DRAFT_587922 [Kockovaella imperatae]ORX39089.1 hypothetical protein BD324DRAFT_587922 [Kockovaella imperatae]
MAYVAVVKSLYDYAAQDPDTELSLKEDQVLYIIEKEDEDWWKAKLKDEHGSEGSIGLIPASYVEEIPPVHQTKSIYAYEATSPEELSMEEDQTIHVYSVEEDWILAQVGDEGSKLGFVPRTYCEPIDEMEATTVVADPEEAEAELQAAWQEEEEAQRQREAAEKQRLLKLKDKVETWSISEMEGKKKKKGTLGVGNGAVFFASDTDKMSGVKQYSITELSGVSQPSSKNLSLSFSTLSEPLLFHCGTADVASAIISKLESSKAAAGEALEILAADERLASDGEANGYDAAPASEPKSVRWAAPAQSASTESAIVLYDFDAQGDDELSVKENETVTVLDKENDEWWTVRNRSGAEGVVPAQYVQINDGTQPAQEEDDEEDEARRAEEEAAAAAALEAERQREAKSKAEQRRAIEKAARERQKQEEEDRQYALELEAKEAAKAEKRARKAETEQRAQRERDAARRREAARELEPPKITKRTSAMDVNQAAKSLPTRGKAAPARPPENNRPKPTPGRTRVWSDKTGQFKVEAEYLGLYNGKIRLHKINGVIIDVPLDKMAQEDIQMIKRHEARKARAQEDPEDNVPLGRRGQPSRSTETRVRSQPEFEPIPAEAMKEQKPRKPRFDWFAFFLDAGCGMDDCTRYAAAFDRDNIDESIMEDLDASTLRSLGLKEGDVLRVRKALQIRFAKKTPEESAQIRADEDYARQLQEHENSGGKGPAPQPPPGLFTGPDGKLSNNTRRGRPEKKGSAADSVDASAIAAASDRLSKANISTPSPPPVSSSPSPEKPAAPAATKPSTGFDDDAWTIKPSAAKPASPPPASPAPQRQSPPPANTTESLLAQIEALRPSSTGSTSQLSQAKTGSSAFDSVASVPQSAPPQPSYNLGVQGSNHSMAQLQNMPRGPVAPIPANQGLLAPLQPAMTGFVPTRGMAPQQTGFQQGPMMMQPTGYAQGFQQGYGGQQASLQPNYTGYPGNYGQQSQHSSFNTIASMRPPEPPSNPDKYAPSNIFAAMKKADFGKPEDQRPQESGKYDALRPLTTGYNGAPGMMPQQTGMMMPQQTGMMPQQTGYGMMPQMTGYNPQMGYMGQNNNPYGQQGYR